MESEKCRKPTPGPAPKSDYRTKYDHLVPNKVGKEAACDITANKQYGNGTFILNVVGIDRHMIHTVIMDLDYGFICLWHSLIWVDN